VKQSFESKLLDTKQMITLIEGNIIDIHTYKIYPGEITIENGRIIEIAKNNKTYNTYIAPGFVDSHVHIESSLLIPSRFAEAAIPHGTIAAVSDPHEIANVCGIEGIEFMIKTGLTVPFYFSFGVPSSVPSTEFESNGATIEAKEIEFLFEKFGLEYLSEVMNYNGVINHDKSTIAKLNIAKKLRKKIDGHAPQLTGKNLSVYAKSGISTDHECSTIKEAIEKINKGFHILIREGSAARNFDALAPLIDLYPEKVMLCTDDFHADNLINFHIDQLIRRGLQMKLNIYNLLRAASLNPVKHYNLPSGLLRKNDSADFIILEDIKNFKVAQTWIKGKPVYAHGNVYFNVKKVKALNKFKAKPITTAKLSVRLNGTKIRVINLKEDELITTQTIEYPKVIEGEVVSDLSNDILKLVVLNRYVENAVPAIAFVKNFGLTFGAIASSISHDSHNIIAVGASDSDIVSAINEVIANKGGIAAAHNDKVTVLKLEIAGLMTQVSAVRVAEQLMVLNNLAKNYGSKLNSPFMSLSFLSLIVIPHIKLSDRGLFNVDTFSFTDLFVE